MVITLSIVLLAIAVGVPAVAAPEDDPVQIAALMALYNSTNGPNWRNNEGWGGGSPYCLWYGVECNESGDVLKLLLGFNYLGGSIPPDLSELTELRMLFLDSNYLWEPFRRNWATSAI